VSDRVAAAAAPSPDVRRLRVLLLATGLTLLALMAPRLVAAQDWRTTSQSREIAGEQSLRVDIEYAAGQLKLSPAPRGTLYRANLRYDASAFTPRIAYAGDRLRVGIEGSNVRGRNLKAGHLDLRISPDVPVDLDMQFGAAEATIDLGGLRIRSAEIATGASSTTLNVSSPNLDSCRELSIHVGAAKFEALRLGNLNAQRIEVEGGVGEVLLDFTGAWRSNMTGKIEMGLGSLTLRVPTSLGVRITKGGFLASFDSQGLVKRGNTYYSENWDKASRTLSLDVSAALGSINVVWVDS
jgi:hypothetical protein